MPLPFSFSFSAHAASPPSAARWIRALALGVLLTACDVESPEETTFFEHADRCYARGDHEGASRLYEEFLAQHPHSPLASTARARLDAIERELDAIIGRRGAPAPVVVRPFGMTPVTERPSAFVPVQPPEIVPLAP